MIGLISSFLSSWEFINSVKCVQTFLGVFSLTLFVTSLRGHWRGGLAHHRGAGQLDAGTPHHRGAAGGRGLVCRGRHWYTLIWRAWDGPVPRVSCSSDPTGEQRTQREVNSHIQAQHKVTSNKSHLLHINLSPNQPRLIVRYYDGHLVSVAMSPSTYFYANKLGYCIKTLWKCQAAHTF